MGFSNTISLWPDVPEFGPFLWSILHGWSSQVSDPDSIRKTNKGIYKPPTNRLDMFSTSNMSSTRRNNMHDRAKWQNATELGFVFTKSLHQAAIHTEFKKKKGKSHSSSIFTKMSPQNKINGWPFSGGNKAGNIFLPLAAAPKPNDHIPYLGIASNQIFPTSRPRDKALHQESSGHDDVKERSVTNIPWKERILQASPKSAPKRYLNSFINCLNWKSGVGVC